MEDNKPPHPDEEWLRATITDLQNWLEEPSSSPTSQISGGGAIERVETQFSALHAGRPTLAMPSASYAMRVALKSLGVTAGTEVLVPALDWPSTSAAVRSLGATPVPVPIDHQTLTIDPTHIPGLRTRHTRALVACHLHGSPADIPALRDALGDDTPIIEDAAHALGATLDGLPVGTLADAATFSFGPGKDLSIGEGAMITTRDWNTWETILRHSGHPVRQTLGGITTPQPANFSIRIHPLAAILLHQQLNKWDPQALRDAHEDLARELSQHNGVQIIGTDQRRQHAAAGVPITTHQIQEISHHYAISPSGAYDITKHTPARHHQENTYIVTRHNPTANEIPSR